MFLFLWFVVLLNHDWDNFLDGFRSRRVRGGKDRRHRSLKAQTGIGGMTEVSGHTTKTR
jgi:hypothetical protein